MSLVYVLIRTFDQAQSVCMVKVIENGCSCVICVHLGRFSHLTE